MRQRKVKYRDITGDAPTGVGEPAGSSDSDEDSPDLEVGGRGRGRRAKKTKVRTTVFRKRPSSS